MKILQKIVESGVGVLIALHDLNLARVIKRNRHSSDERLIFLLNEGVVVASGRPSEVIRSEILAKSMITPISVEERKGKLHVYKH